ncbi:MAG: flippase-like domain-containing protein [Candidatus Roizmanbacteria bacterium]|nr:MAG: flippase-like domain-containing protein [Candidatus Roizmanbacteria bacterium]
MEKLKSNLRLSEIQKQEKKIIYVFILSLFIYLIFVFYGDIQKITKVASLFNWKLVPLILFFTLLNYFLRAVRFYFYLKSTNNYLSFYQSLIIFFSGLSMTVTPGKSGEVIKAYLAKKIANKKFSEIIPILVFERLTDGIAMLIMAVGGIFIVQNSKLFFILSALFVLLFVIFIKGHNYFLLFINFLEKKIPRLKVLDFFIIFFSHSQKLLRPRTLLFGIFIGFVAWSFEGLSMYLLVKEFVNTDVIKAITLSFFIFSFSSIAGFFVLIPGGIGVAEGSMTYFLTQFFPLSLPQSIFIVLIFRFLTLWFGVSLGLSILIAYLRKSISDNKNQV